MGTFRPRLLEAVTASARMDAICEFIEFWLGARQPSFGETSQAVNERPLPLPLKRLYQFAGCWPHRNHQGPIEYTVPAFSHQDNLLALQSVKHKEDGRIVFLGENQEIWDCLTLSDGEDPPVWCYGDQFDEEGAGFRGEQLVCNSLSRFLTTFVMQELTLGSHLYLTDEGLKTRFQSERDSAIPVWTDGPYVNGAVHNYYLWGDVLVAELGGDPFLGANHDEGVKFLTENQGQVNLIGLMMGLPWRLDIRPDGSARIQYLRGQTEESAEATIGTFDFPNLLATLSTEASNEGHYERNAMVFFYRQMQKGTVFGKHLHDVGLVTFLFQRALERATKTNRALTRLWASEWPV